jgi:hypothetical protein
MTFFQFAFSVDDPNPGLFDGEIVVGVFKLLFVLFAFLYLIFAFVVTRQIKVMRTTLITPFSPFVRVLGYTHFIFASIVFLSFILFL